ncbi:extracellular solute-binding protein [Anaerocolumna sp. MB42-C2]|uniref:extracellular solute-binding protein n=1 Tax=Anaerocolumna sp. MB42-C2 TaxID=3070997 RepID=UPI0027E047B2|nr:extracellular solute-binding protein [Anaerocolumna sp. MB42-C2]WMJ87147.1 extracellular solute-binding protein [Anaerocolumna sp. MB42-C2]
MKNNRRRITAILFTIILVMSSFTGCKSSDSKSTGGTSDGKISGTITVGGWPSGDDAFKAAMAGFNEQYPDIKVELQFTDTTSHHQALQTALAAGTDAPDVAMVEGAYIAQYRDSSALTNLLEEPYNAGDLKDDFVAYKWEQANSSDGSRFVAIPWDIGPCSYFYRTDVFKEAGLPTNPDEVAKLMSTWDGVLKVAEAVNIPGKRWLIPDASYLYFELFCNRDYYDKDLNLQIQRDGDLDCLNAVIKMRQNKWDMNVDMWSSEAYAGYAAGTCASVFTGAWFGGFLKTDIDPDGAGHWAVTTLPGAVKSSNWGGSFLVIPKQSKNKDAAWAFIKYMLATAKGQNDMFQAVDYYPAYKPAWDDKTIYDAEDPYFGGEKTKALWAKIASELQPVNTTMMDTTAEGCIYSSVNAGLEQGLSAEQIRDLVASDIEKATAEVKQQQIQVLKDAGLWDK